MAVSSNKTEKNKDRVKALESLNEYKIACEANIVAIIYKHPELFYDIEIKQEEISNNLWKVFYAVAAGVLGVEGKNTLDSVTVGLYLDKHPKLRDVYEKFGGYEIVEKTFKYVDKSNLDGYIEELKKWNFIIYLGKNDFPIENKLSEYNDMTLEDIYNKYEMILNHSALNIGGKVKTYNPLEGLMDLIDDLNDGAEVGMPMAGSKLINTITGGINFHGKIYALGAGTGVGKSTTMLNLLIPAIIEHDEKLVIMINEEDNTKIQKELLIWTANNIIGKKLKKHKLRNGSFDNDTYTTLVQAAKWLEQYKDRKNIVVIPLEKYTCKIVKKTIKKYYSMGVRLFVLDTFKESADNNVNDQTWKSMERDMRQYYDLIKPVSLNCTLFFTYQLTKGSIKTRRITDGDVGQAKNILDVIDCNIALRRPFDDEFSGGRREITCKKTIGSSTVPVKLERGEHYMIVFVNKNRFGEKDVQFVVKYDLATNKLEDVGTCIIPEDW